VLRIGPGERAATRRDKCCSTWQPVAVGMPPSGPSSALRPAFRARAPGVARLLAERRAEKRTAAVAADRSIHSWLIASTSRRLAWLVCRSWLRRGPATPHAVDTRVWYCHRLRPMIEHHCIRLADSEVRISRLRTSQANRNQTGTLRSGGQTHRMRSAG
jgi:hypothetical protein